MAYQNVGTPRFYVNLIEFLHSNGVLENIHEANRTLPVNPTNYNPDFSYNIPKILTEKGFVFLLGHNLKTIGVEYSLANWNNPEHKVNSNPVGYDGFSLTLFNEPNLINIDLQVHHSANIGSVVIGTYYDMPHSPDLSLTMEREYGGIKTIETKGGASLSNSFYTKPPKWGELGAWELSDGTTLSQALSRSGRRVWNLSFSYLQGSDVFGSNQGLDHSMLDHDITNDEVGGTADNLGWEIGQSGQDNDISGSGTFNYNILSDDNFYSQVIHKTNGGQLPFIFQPDSKDFTQFAICKFDQNSFQFKQVANGVYNVNLKIREVW
tara:strand:+ start:14318 stop:15283 length:966 start_codon:yes stop_codon:yes gene_type:complete